MPRKNEFRKAHAQRHTTIPYPNLTVLVWRLLPESDEELIVSILIDVVHDTGVSTITELQRRINILSILHNGKLMASYECIVASEHTYSYFIHNNIRVD